MHLFNVATILILLSLVSVEFSVAAFVDPAAWRLDPEPQLKLLSRLASVLGKVMPVWYPLSALLLGIQTWLYWHSSERGILLTADAIWLLASVGSIIFWFRSILAWRRVMSIGSGYIGSGTRDIVCAPPLSPSRPSCSPTYLR